MKTLKISLFVVGVVVASSAVAMDHAAKQAERAKIKAALTARPAPLDRATAKAKRRNSGSDWVDSTKNKENILTPYEKAQAEQYRKGTVPLEDVEIDKVVVNKSDWKAFSLGARFQTFIQTLRRSSLRSINSHPIISATIAIGVVLVAYAGYKKYTAKKAEKAADTTQMVIE